MATTPPTPPSNPVPPGPPPIRALGEEYGTAKKNLPPVKIVLAAVGVLLLVVAIFAFVQRPQSSARGRIDELAVADVPDQRTVMVAINLTLHNGGASSFKMREIKVEEESGGSVNSDEPASAVDFDRYLQAFPALKAH